MIPYWKEDWQGKLLVQNVVKMVKLSLFRETMPCIKYWINTSYDSWMDTH